MQVATLLDELHEYLSRQPDGTLVLLDVRDMDEPDYQPDPRHVARAERHRDDFLVYIGESIDEHSSPHLSAAELGAILDALPAGSEGCSVEATEGPCEVDEYVIRYDIPVNGTGEALDGSAFVLTYETRRPGSKAPDIIMT